MTEVRQTNFMHTTNGYFKDDTLIIFSVLLLVKSKSAILWQVKTILFDIIWKPFTDGC